MPKPQNLNRVCFWLPRPWRRRLLAVLCYDGRRQAEFVRTATTNAIEAAENRIARAK